MKVSIQSSVLAAVVAASMCAAAQAVPETYTWNFDSPQGALGTSQSYTSAVTPSGPSPVDVTAYGFQVKYSGKTATQVEGETGKAIDLYGKQQGGTENGLGLNNYPDSEIGFRTVNQDGQDCQYGDDGSTTYEGFVQVDLTNLLNIPNVDPFATITIGSLQNGTYDAFASSTLGTIGTNEIINHSTTTPNTFLLSDFSLADPYLTITANDQKGLDKSILLSTLSVSTNNAAPEPATLGMLAIGGAGLLLGRRRKTA